LAGVKARAIRFAGIPIRSEATPDQLAERYAESLGLTIRALAQFIWKQNGGAMHMALIASAYGGVNHRVENFSPSLTCRTWIPLFSMVF
jgi:hypothetical protein